MPTATLYHLEPETAKILGVYLARVDGNGQLRDPVRFTEPGHHVRLVLDGGRGYQQFQQSLENPIAHSPYRQADT